jgi:hypothetical protein
MGQSFEPAPSWSPATTPRSISHGLYDQQPTPSHYSYQGTSPYTPHDYSCSPHHYPPPPYGYDGYPNPATDPEGRHINKKYSTEEGDFIIYAWHDKKLKWQAIKQEYAMIFGKKPRRTVQGLQAWYYRMNQKIPVWDSDGWLIFDGEDELEPRQVSIKCRERDQGRRRVPELMGLAQRYPERLMGYHWVDPEIKQQARDWGTSTIPTHPLICVIIILMCSSQRQSESFSTESVVRDERRRRHEGRGCSFGRLLPSHLVNLNFDASIHRKSLAPRSIGFGHTRCDHQQLE